MTTSAYQPKLHTATLTLTVPSSDAVQHLPPELLAVLPTVTALTLSVWSLNVPYGFPLFPVSSLPTSRETRKTWMDESKDAESRRWESDVNVRDVIAR